MIENLVGFYSQAHEAVEYFDSFFTKHHLAGMVVPDHIAFKCASSDEYNALRAILEEGSDYIHQATISGRRIAYCKLRQGVPTSLGDVHYIELAEQKPDGSQKSGFDHLEIYPTSQTTYEALIAAIQKRDEQIIRRERPHHPTDDITLPSGLQVRIEQSPLIEVIKTEMSEGK